MSAPELPRGTVTFLFTDIEGSTQLLQQLRDDYAHVLADQRAVLRAAFEQWCGREVDTQGDSFFVVFERAGDAIGAAVEAQRALAARAWTQGIRLRVRMGVHTGEPQIGATGYVGLAVHRAARICAAGHGGQVLLSQTTHGLIASDLPAGVSLRDLGKHRLKDLPHAEPIYQIVCADLPSDFPPLKTLDACPNNLPLLLTRFVGRARELAQIKELLATTRLLTLTGVGGTGKTRLAIQVAGEMLAQFADGVWLVELAPLTDPARVPRAAAAALGLREDAGRAVLDTLADYARTKNLLLVLDNCEHLIEACAQFAQTLLCAAPGLKIVATSREALGIAGETTLRVPSLATPDPDYLPPPQTLSEYEAVRLFVDRAAAAQPDWCITDANAPAVAQICHRLDGIPLALELAAARVRVLSVEQIAARLDDCFRLLTGGSRTAHSRQQTLQAAMDWSYDLLSEPERVLLRRLAVFAGGWTLEAAEAVCAQDVLDLLSHLVSKSLVSVEERLGVARYRLLETIRQYARDKLIQSGEATRVRAAHFDLFLQLASDAAPQLVRAQQLAWLERLETEHDNLRAALSWALEQNRGESALQLVIALNLFWLRRDYVKEGSEQIERALAQTEALGHTPLRVRVMALSVLFALYQGDFTRARAFVQTYLTHARALGDARSEGELLWGLGWLAWHDSDYAGAQALFEQCLERFTALRDSHGCADALHFWGHVAVDQGDHDTAQRYFAQSSTLYKEWGDHIGLLPLVGDLGLVAYLQGDFDHARAFCEQQLALGRTLDSKDNQIAALNRLGDLARCAGDDATAEKHYSASLEILQPLGVTPMLGNLQHNLAHVAKNRGDYAHAGALFRASLTLYREQNDKKGIGESLGGFAGVAAAIGNLECAARLFGAAESLRETINATLWPANRIAYERDVGALRARLGAEKLATMWAEGRTLTLEQAIELALSQMPVQPPII